MTPSVEIYDPDEIIKEEPLRVTLVSTSKGIQLRVVDQWGKAHLNGAILLLRHNKTLSLYPRINKSLHIRTVCDGEIEVVDIESGDD